MSKKCIITVGDMNQDFHNGIERLEAMGIKTEWNKKLLNSSDSQAVIEACREYNYVIAGSENWSSETIASCPNVECIVRFGVGYDGVDVDFATAKGIAVANTPGANSFAVAEHALALMLAVSRRLIPRDRAIRSKHVGSSINCTPSLSESTVGILGCGSIGKNLIRLLKGFNCTILAYDVQPDLEFASSNGIRYVSLDELYRKSDFISLHAPLVPSTRHMINKDTISLMKENVIIINTSRGGLVNGKDLAEALKTKRVYGAGLDVFEDEGHMDSGMGSDYYGTENAILTPHCASHTLVTFSSMLDTCVSIIEKYINGEEIPSLLNKDYIKYR